jgi:ketosteroid isomerase-like protein
MRRSTTMTLMLACAFSAPSFAQQTNGADQPTRQQAEAIVNKYVDAVNKGDTQAYSDLFAPDAIDINPFGKHKKTAKDFGATLDMTRKLGLTLHAKVEDVEPLLGGQGAFAIASYTGSYSNYPVAPNVSGNFLFVLERIGDAWKIRVQSAARLAPAAMMK